MIQFKEVLNGRTVSILRKRVESIQESGDETEITMFSGTVHTVKMKYEQVKKLLKKE